PALTGIALVGLFAAACVDATPGLTPPSSGERSLDEQVRASVSGWGVVPILPVNAQDPALVDLGKSLFFDKILSGNRDVSCATCHSPLASSGDELSPAVGTGAILPGNPRKLGAGRQFTPRNAPSLFNSALGMFYIFWDGRLSEQLGPGRFQTPSDITLPSGVSGLLAAQAMIPVTNRVEMRGEIGDRDVLGNPN